MPDIRIGVVALFILATVEITSSDLDQVEKSWSTPELTRPATSTSIFESTNLLKPLIF